MLTYQLTFDISIFAGLFKGHGQKATVWKRGVPATVIWESSAYHRGGYAYRLCGPVVPGKEWKVNEQCFRDGHLKFVGKTILENTHMIDP